MPTPRAANPPSRLNRALLTLAAVVLLLAGAYLLAFGLGLLRPLLQPMRLGLDPAGTLLPQSVTLPVWATYVAIVVAVVIGLLALRWILAQTRRRPRTGTWNLAGGAAGGPATGGAVATGGRTTLAADTAADAVAADITAYPGVRKASAVLTGSRGAPRLLLEVSTERDTSLAAVRDRITGHALPRLRHALDLDVLPAQLLLRIDAGASTTPRAR